jgi:hypothetical protein
MKMELFHFTGKKKKRAKDQNMGEMAPGRGNGEADNGDSSGSDVMDKIVAGVSSNLSKSTAKKPSPHDTGVDIIVDSDEDEIFDDEDDDDVADDSEAGDLPSAKIDYRDMLAAGASAIVAPIQKVVNATNRDDEESQRTGDSYHSSDAESEDEDEEDAEDTESDDDDEDKPNSKGGGGSDSGEDYTDDEDEGEDGYRPGGYHPVKIGEVYNQR